MGFLKVNRNAVQFGHLRRLEPVSKNWGLDRGTPIDRYYIEKFLQKNAAEIQGKILEFGDSTYARKYGGSKVENIEVMTIEKDNPNSTIIADLTKAKNVPSDEFDCIICTQVLNYIYDFNLALKQLYRILKPGGVILTTVPVVSKTCLKESWTNYWRFTSRCSQMIFKEVFPEESIRVESYGNVLTSVSFLHGLAVEELAKEELDFKDPEYEMIIAVRAKKPK